MKRIVFLTENSISLQKYMNYGKKMTYGSFLNIGKWVRISKEHYDILLEKKNLKTIVIKKDFITIQTTSEIKQQKFKHKLWKKKLKRYVFYILHQKVNYVVLIIKEKKCILKIKSENEILINSYLKVKNFRRKKYTLYRRGGESRKSKIKWI